MLGFSFALTYKEVDWIALNHNNYLEYYVFVVSQLHILNFHNLISSEYLNKSADLFVSIKKALLDI